MTTLDKLTDREIAQWRLHTQRLVGEQWDDPVSVVEGLLAVQAENFSQSGWAVAARCDPSPTEGQFLELFDSGRLLRTHVIRPTWHYVVPDDIVWLTELTAPRIRKSFISSQQQAEGVTDRLRDRMVDFIVDTIGDEGPLTRKEVQDRLHGSGLPSSGAAVTLTMGMAETSALVCSGPRRDDAQTYALVSDRVPGARRLDRSEALAELALRYVTGHGPITERDMSYWASLALTDVRHGLAAVGDLVDSFGRDGLTFWFRRGHEPPPASKSSAHLLQILDEIYRGYHPESRWVLDEARIIERTREKAIGMALIDAQLVATMTRRLTATEIEFTLGPYRPLADDELSALHRVASDYGRYCNRVAVLTCS